MRGKRYIRLAKITVPAIIFTSLIVWYFSPTPYCFELLDSESATPAEVEKFISTVGSSCKAPFLIDLLARSNNRSGFERALNNGLQPQEESYPAMIKNGWFDLLPEDLNWDFPAGARGGAYSDLCLIKSNEVFIEYFRRVSDGGRTDSSGGCLHGRITTITFFPDLDMEGWEKSVRFIVKKGGHINATDGDGRTALDRLVENCAVRGESAACDQAIAYLVSLGAESKFCKNDDSADCVTVYRGLFSGNKADQVKVDN